MRQIRAVSILLLLKEDRLFRSTFQEDLKQALTKMPVIPTQHVLHLKLLPEVLISVLLNRLVLPVRGFRPLSNDSDIALTLGRRILTLLPFPISLGILLDRIILLRDQKWVIHRACRTARVISLIVGRVESLGSRVEKKEGGNLV